MHHIFTKNSQSHEKNSQFSAKAQEKLFMHKYSASVVIRNDYVRKDGTSAIYLRIRINGINLPPYPLNIYVKHSEWNAEKECVVLSRGEQLKQLEFNEIINDAKAKANDVFKDARRADLVLNKESFERKYFKSEIYRDFIPYLEKNIYDRINNKAISKGSYKIELRALKYLKEYKSTIPFNHLTKDFFRQWRGFLVTVKEQHTNSIRNLEKKISFYIKQAKEEGIDVPNPLENFIIKQVAANRDYLNDTELNEWIALLNNPIITGRHREVLEATIFSAINGGFRISDLKKLGINNLVENIIIFTPFKTRDKKRIPVQIDLTEPGNKIIARRRTQERFFDLPSDQQVNVMIKDILRFTSIKKKVTSHTFRHTFATSYISKGGAVNHLAMIMGIEQKTVIQNYVHTDVNSARKSVSIMNNVIIPTTGSFVNKNQYP